MKKVRKISQIRSEPLVGTNNSASSDIWDLRMKLREVIRVVNKLLEEYGKEVT